MIERVYEKPSREIRFGIVSVTLKIVDYVVRAIMPFVFGYLATASSTFNSLATSTTLILFITCPVFHDIFNIFASIDEYLLLSVHEDSRSYRHD